MAASNTPFPCFKTTGDDKHDIDIYTEDLRDYCVIIIIIIIIIIKYLYSAIYIRMISSALQ